MATTYQDNYSFVEPLAAQHSFADKFNLDNPSEAANSYARYMAEHTRAQLQIIDPSAAASAAASSSRRRSSAAANSSTAAPPSNQDPKTPSLSPESSMGSVDA